MKVLHVIDDQSNIGLLLYISELIEHLRSNGVESVVISLSPVSQDFLIPVTSLGIELKTFQLPIAFQKLRSLFRELKPDAVIAHSPWAQILVPPAARLEGVSKNMTFEHGERERLGWRNNIFGIVSNAFSQKSLVGVVVDEALPADLSGETWTGVPYGFTLPAIGDESLMRDKLRVGVWGDRPELARDFLIHAKESSKFEFLSLGLKNVIEDSRSCDWKSRRHLEEMIQASDVLVSFDLRPGSWVTMLYLATRGKTLLVPRSAQSPKVFQWGENCMAYDPGDWESLMNSLNALRADQTLREGLSKALRRDLESSANIQTQFSKLSSYFL
ncbi:MAG: hypothetical protein KDD25_01280 [Bdellovibrionales bacterium]|nr:hypothetical protein [Bdellovibrionales bacterium]